MDQHGEKEEHKPQDPTDQRQEMAAAAGDASEESTGQCEGYNKAEEPAGVRKEAVAGSDEASPPLFAHPCALLHLLLRACAGCLGLHGCYCGSSDDNPKPAAAVPASPEAAAAAAAAAAQDPSREGEGGAKADYSYVQEEIVTRVLTVRSPAPPNRPREGSGGNGGVHN